LVMFTGIMNAVRYGKILESSLVPFMKTFSGVARLRQARALDFFAPPSAIYQNN